MMDYKQLDGKIEKILRVLQKETRLMEKILNILTEIYSHLKNMNNQGLQRVQHSLPPSLLRVLNELMSAQTWLTVSELSKRLGILPETTYRYLTHLHIMGFVIKQRVRKGGESYFENRLYQINPTRLKEIEELLQFYPRKNYFKMPVEESTGIFLITKISISVLTISFLRYMSAMPFSR
jgi:predicted transcriptional regulator